MKLEVLGILHNDMKEKFAIPRQSSLAPDLVSTLVMEKAFSDPAAFRTLEQFSHLWLIWGFSRCPRGPFRPTVRPPKLGGNQRVGVFATRSPFRPNPLGLSSVRLLGIKQNAQGQMELSLGGADLADGTPVYDIKPYLPYTDAHPQAACGWADPALHPVLQVEFPAHLWERLPPETRIPCRQLLAQDPRPSYQNDPQRQYTFTYGTQEISFTVADNTLTVTDVRDKAQ